MIAKIIALVIHEVKDAYDQIDHDRESMKELVKVSLADLITEIKEKKGEEEDKILGFSLPHKNDRRKSRDKRDPERAED